MSLAASAPPPGDDPPEPFLPDDVQHVWLPTHRSLCDLATQAYEDAEKAAAINDRATQLPVCGACEVVVGMLERRLKTLQASGTGSMPIDQHDAVDLLRHTRWAWVSQALR